MNNFFLKIYVSASTRLRSQAGAETVQVIMIMGIMALLIAAIFAPGSPVYEAIEELASKVKTAIQNI